MLQTQYFLHCFCRQSIDHDTERGNGFDFARIPIVVRRLHSPSPEIILVGDIRASLAFQPEVSIPIRESLEITHQRYQDNGGVLGPTDDGEAHVHGRIRRTSFHEEQTQRDTYR